MLVYFRYRTSEAVDTHKGEAPAKTPLEEDKVRTSPSGFDSRDSLSVDTMFRESASLSAF
jgi:hypothetical protein